MSLSICNGALLNPPNEPQGRKETGAHLGLRSRKCRWRSGDGGEAQGRVGGRHHSRVPVRRPADAEAGPDCGCSGDRGCRHQCACKQ